MDDRERDYFRQMIHDLERAKRLWQVLAFTLLAAFVLFLIVGMGSIVLYSIGNVRLAAQMREEAQMQAEQARAQAEVAAVRAQEAEAATQRLKEAEMKSKQLGELMEKEKQGTKKSGEQRDKASAPKQSP